METAFLSDAQKLNKKRQAQLIKRVTRVLDELREAHQKGDAEEVEGILATLQMPSSKEWRKVIKRLVLSSAKAGVLRAHLELLKLRELYAFADIEVVTEATDLKVVFPKEAMDFIDKYAYEIGIITEATVIERIKEHLRVGLQEGLTTRELTEHIRKVSATWLSKSHAETIARTETGKMYNAGRLARWLDPDTNGFVEALQYDAIVDRRTTDLCKSLDGMVVAVSNGAKVAEYTPPNHYKCRATWLPITKFEEWEENFEPSEKPEKGFVFEPNYSHKLLEGKKSPLVQEDKG
ncbi:phage head morphogenesis protein [Bacillus paralicheniformis]|uniref:phage head morphogenesis protein n=1 Tax=Bacillus paralicheniformis TaxID=1648923 RepID=UPI0016495F84|nr:minor capsid protein [Bacillus paralicheniformis]